MIKVKDRQTESSVVPVPVFRKAKFEGTHEFREERFSGLAHERREASQSVEEILRTK
jgi:hypothetical protein